MTADPSIVEVRRNRRTGTTITLIDVALTTGDVEDGGRWMTQCEDHGYNVQHLTRATARSWMAEPDWCEMCQALMTEEA